MQITERENKKDITEGQVKEDIKTEYLFSSDRGDIPVNKEMMTRPFITRPMEVHQFLTLGDFFYGIANFFLKDKGLWLIDLIHNAYDRRVSRDDIESLIIRYEKYGTLYHILSIEVNIMNFKAKFALSAAQFQEAKKILNYEFKIIEDLHANNTLPYIPRQFHQDTIEIGEEQNIERFLVTVSEWFEDYHEWHFSGDEEDAKQAVIWDMEHGYRTLKTEEIKSIIHGASKILTLYYDIETCRSITRWHHGAGDFVVKISGNHDIDIRLVTIRGYRHMIWVDRGEADPFNNTIDFLLHMTIKMRIDKNEGMGEPVWADAFILESVLHGFFEGLRMKEDNGIISVMVSVRILGILKRIGERGLKHKLSVIADALGKTDPVDYKCIKKNLKTHIKELYEAIQGL